MSKAILVMAMILASCRGVVVPPSGPVPVLAWPAGECPPDLTFGEASLQGDLDQAKMSNLVKGIQVFFADYLRAPIRSETCLRRSWTAYCIRPEQIDSFFTIDSVVATYGDEIGFADLRFRNGKGFRMCFNGGAYPLDGARFADGQERCPKGERSRRSALPLGCQEGVVLPGGLRP
jgi:hypothetical protein